MSMNNIRSDLIYYSLESAFSHNTNNMEWHVSLSGSNQVHILLKMYDCLYVKGDLQKIPDNCDLMHL